MRSQRYFNKVFESAKYVKYAVVCPIFPFDLSRMAYSTCVKQSDFAYSTPHWIVFTESHFNLKIYETTPAVIKAISAILVGGIGLCRFHRARGCHVEYCYR